MNNYFPGTALGPYDHPDLAETLEEFAALLRQTDREAEATDMEARAREIRDRHERANAR